MIWYPDSVDELWVAHDEAELAGGWSSTPARPINPRTRYERTISEREVKLVVGCEPTSRSGTIRCAYTNERIQWVGWLSRSGPVSR